MKVARTWWPWALAINIFGLQATGGGTYSPCPHRLQILRSTNGAMRNFYRRPVIRVTYSS